MLISTLAQSARSEKCTFLVAYYPALTSKFTSETTHLPAGELYDELLKDAIYKQIVPYSYQNIDESSQYLQRDNLIGGFFSVSEAYVNGHTIKPCR